MVVEKNQKQALVNDIGVTGERNIRKKEYVELKKYEMLKEELEKRK